MKQKRLLSDRRRKSNSMIARAVVETQEIEDNAWDYVEANDKHWKITRERDDSA